MWKKNRRILCQHMDRWTSLPPLVAKKKNQFHSTQMLNNVKNFRTSGQDAFVERLTPGGNQANFSSEVT